MAMGYIVSHSALTLGVQCQRVCRNISLTHVGEKKRWMKAYTFVMARKFKLEGPPPPKPRNATPTPTATVCPCPPLTSVSEEEHNLYSASGVLTFIQSTTRRAYHQVLEVLDENPRSKPSLRGGSASSSNPLHDTRLALTTLDTTLDGGTVDMTVVDATTLRRQLIKLTRRLHLLEEVNKERAKREVNLYWVTVAFWLINTWVWLRR